MKLPYSAMAAILIALASGGATSAHGMDGLLLAQAPPNQFNQVPPTNAPTMTPVAPTFYGGGILAAVMIAAAVSSVCWSSRRS